MPVRAVIARQPGPERPRGQRVGRSVIGITAAKAVCFSCWSTAGTAVYRGSRSVTRSRVVQVVAGWVQPISTAFIATNRCQGLAYSNTCSNRCRIWCRCHAADDAIVVAAIEAGARAEAAAAAGRLAAIAELVQRRCGDDDDGEDEVDPRVFRARDGWRNSASADGTGCADHQRLTGVQPDAPRPWTARTTPQDRGAAGPGAISAPTASTIRGAPIWSRTIRRWP